MLRSGFVRLTALASLSVLFQSCLAYALTPQEVLTYAGPDGSQMLVAGVRANFISPEAFEKYTGSSEKIYQDLFH